MATISGHANRKGIELNVSNHWLRFTLVKHLLVAYAISIPINDHGRTKVKSFVCLSPVSVVSQESVSKQNLCRPILTWCCDCSQHYKTII